MREESLPGAVSGPILPSTPSMVANLIRNRNLQMTKASWNLSAGHQLIHKLCIQSEGSSIGSGGSVVFFGAFGAGGRWFESHSVHHVGTLGKSFISSCLYDVMWRPTWLPCG